MSAWFAAMTILREAVRQRQDVFLLHHFLSPAECRAWIARGEAHGFEKATINGPRGPVLAESVRNNDRWIFDDAELAAEWWARVQDASLPTFGPWHPIAFNERFRMYRYRPGQQFATHYDGSFQRTRDESSWLTFLVYLNEDFTGGETRFSFAHEPDTVSISPRTGSALVFVHDRLHEGATVRSGLKYVLRTDVMYRRGRRELRA